jgi:hypothetical protein
LEKGRYTTYSTKHWPTRRRRIDIPGSFEDKGKYIRCWNCGFIVDTDRDMGDQNQSGNYETDMVVESQSRTGSGSDTLISMDTLGMVGVLLKNDGQDGNPVTKYYTPRIPQVSKGCPLCGCTAL